MVGKLIGKDIYVVWSEVIEEMAIVTFANKNADTGMYHLNTAQMVPVQDIMKNIDILRND